MVLPVFVVVIQHSQDTGYDFCNLCVEEVLAIESAKGKSLISIIAPRCRECHYLPGLFIKGKLVVTVVEV